MPPTAAFSEIFADATEEITVIGEVLETAILSQHPESVVVPYPGYHSVSYGVGAKKNSEAYAYLMPQKDRVNLGFYRGANLPDPAGVLEGTGKELRHVKLRDREAATSGAVGDLIRAAVAERKPALGAN